MKVDIRGMYIPIRTIKSQEEWEKIIEAFVSLGAFEQEGREGRSVHDYSEYWSNWSYIGVSSNGNVVHWDSCGSYKSYHCQEKEITKEYLFSPCEQLSCSTDQFTSLSHEAATVIEALLDYIDGLPKDIESSGIGVDRDWVEGVMEMLKENN